MLLFINVVSIGWQMHACMIFFAAHMPKCQLKVEQNGLNAGLEVKKKYGQPV
jgi:hypothetical protein